MDERIGKWLFDVKVASVSDENIYAILVHHLPRLEEDIERLLSEDEEA
jgi:hypothetical protein